MESLQLLQQRSMSFDLHIGDSKVHPDFDFMLAFTVGIHLPVFEKNMASITEFKKGSANIDDVLQNLENKSWQNIHSYLKFV